MSERLSFSSTKYGPSVISGRTTQPVAALAALAVPTPATCEAITDGFAAVAASAPVRAVVVGCTEPPPHGSPRSLAGRRLSASHCWNAAARTGGQERARRHAEEGEGLPAAEDAPYWEVIVIEIHLLCLHAFPHPQPLVWFADHRWLGCTDRHRGPVPPRGDGLGETTAGGDPSGPKRNPPAFWRQRRSMVQGSAGVRRRKGCSASMSVKRH